MRNKGSGFKGSGFRVQRFRVQGSKVQGSGFKGSGFRVVGSVFLVLFFSFHSKFDVGRSMFDVHFFQSLLGENNLALMP
jgi:hypothetical protein